MLNSIAALTRPHLPPSAVFLPFRHRLSRASNFLFIHSPGVTTDIHYLDIDSLNDFVQKKGETGFRLWKLILLTRPYSALSSHQDTKPEKPCDRHYPYHPLPPPSAPPTSPSPLLPSPPKFPSPLPPARQPNPPLPPRKSRFPFLHLRKNPSNGSGNATNALASTTSAPRAAASTTGTTSAPARPSPNEIAKRGRR